MKKVIIFVESLENIVDLAESVEIGGQIDCSRSMVMKLEVRGKIELRTANLFSPSHLFLV